MPIGNQVQARVTTEDGKLNQKISASLISRRLADKETKVAFFNASFAVMMGESTNILEIGDRVADEPW